MKKSISLLFFLLLSFAADAAAQEWVQTNGPTDNNISSILFNKNKDMFVLSDEQSGILIRSTDHGMSWKRIAIPWKVWNLAILPNNDIYSTFDFSAGIIKSTDNGDTWVRLPGFGIDNLKASPDGTLYGTSLEQDDYLLWHMTSKDHLDSLVIGISGLGTTHLHIGNIEIDSNGVLILNIVNGGIFTSADKGKTWNQRRTDSFNNIICGHGTTIFMTSYDFGPLFRSTDDGKTWSQLPISPSKLSISPSGRILAEEETDLLYSDDNGSTWKEYGVDPQMNFLGNGVFIASDADTGFFALVNNMLYHANEPGFDPWTVYSVPISSVYSEIVAADGSLLVSNGSVFRSSDGGNNWKPVQINPIWHFSNWFIMDSNKDVIGERDDLLLSSDNGKDWGVITPPYVLSFPGSLTAGVVYPNGLIVIAAQYNYGLFLSSDLGHNWQLRDPPQSDGSSLALNSKNGFLFAADSGVIYRSVDTGHTWQSFPIQGKVGNFTFDLYGDILATDQSDGISLSIDNGETWTKFSTTGITATIINTLLSTPSGIIFAATDSGVYKLDPLRCIWTPYSTGLSTLNILSLAIDKHGRLYAGSAGTGIYKSIDTFNVPPKATGLIHAYDMNFGTLRVGETRCGDMMIRNNGSAPFTLTKFDVMDPTPFSVDPQSASLLPALIKPKDSIIMRICFHPPQPAVYASQIDWSTDIELPLCTGMKPQSFLSGTALQKKSVESSLPNINFTLHPNPASGNTETISFSEELSEIVQLSIFDVLGREVYQNKIMPGAKEFEIPVRDLAEGSYFVRMVIGGIAQSGQFVRVKN